MDKDSFNMEAFGQVHGFWPNDHPLPLPAWSHEIKPTLVIDKVEKYEELCAVIETELSRILDGTYYDTVRNYIEFYQAWKASGIKNLESFFRSYKVSVNRRHQSCVSLAMETIARLIAIIPMLRDYMYVASCEEAVENVQEYLESSDLDADEENLYSFEKEHCLAAMKIRVQGRDGVMLLDLGYHVGRPVTVMDDNIYPHTGWFVQADEPHCKREFSYNYVPNGPHLVRWTEKITRGEKIEIIKSLIYVKRPFATAVDVANRRNLVYNFRSIMARDPKGRLCAGFFFPVRMDNDQQLTLFYDGPNKISVRVKQKFSIFKDPENIPAGIKAHLEAMSPQFRMDVKELADLLKTTYEIMSDHDFKEQMLRINETITELTAED